MEIDDNNLHKCAHCSSTGTCGGDNTSEACAACVKRQELKKGSYLGLACGTCGGLGKTDTMTHRLNNRATPFMAIYILVACFFLVTFFGLMNNEHFSEILVFSGTLIGAVTGHYFGKQSKVKT